MVKKHPRMRRESATITAMIELYCHRQHKNTEGISQVLPERRPTVKKALCPECRDLLDYAQKRLDKCPFQEGKTTCAKCPVHCYTPAMRSKIRAAMRFSGPRMIYRHPVVAIFHLLDRLRKEPLPAPKR